MRGGKGGRGIFIAKEAQVFRICNDPLMQVWVFHPVSRDDRRRIQLLQGYKSISIHPLFNCVPVDSVHLRKFFKNQPLHVFPLTIRISLLLETFEVYFT